MISPIGSISGYSVQAIYGNPVSTRAVKPVSEDSSANRAMMTVSKKNEIDVQSQPSKIEQDKPESNRQPVKGVASGGEAEIVKQLEQLQKSISRKNPFENEEESERESEVSSMMQNPFELSTNAMYSNTFLEMGFQQNIRDKVSSSEAQSQVAEMTQKAQLSSEDVSSILNRPVQESEATNNQSSNQAQYSQMFAFSN